MILVALTLLLVIAGASVKSQEAGLSVPDWPLSYGRWMPEMRGGVFYEHGHRMIAALVGLLTLVLAIWLSWTSEPAWLKRLGWVAVAVVILQGLLGGLTVLWRLPKPVSIGHAGLAQLFFALVASLALFTSPGWKREPQVFVDEGRPPLCRLASALPILVLGQILLGAAYRHQAMSLVPHVIGALVVTAYAVLVAAFALQQFGQHAQIGWWARRLLEISLVQMFLGIAAYLSRIYTAESPGPAPVTVVVTVLHVAGGSLTLAASTVLALQARRHTRPAF